MNVHYEDVDLESLKPFQDIPGAVGWICPPCWKNHRSMTEIKKDNKMLHEKVDNLTELIKSVLDTNVLCTSPSPPRKVSRMGVEFDDNDNPSFTPLTTVSSRPLRPLSQYVPTSFAKTPEAPNSRAEVKLNLKKSAESTSTVLQEIHRARHDLPAFSGRKKKDGSHDIIFKNLSDARKAKDILDEKISKFVAISSPEHDNLKKYRIVGLEFEMTVDEITESIIRENSSWLKLDKIKEGVIQIKDDPNAVMYINDVSMCRNREYRMVNVSMSPNMIASIGLQKIALGYVKCKIYEVNASSRCYRCQRHGHFADNCKNKLACSRCSLEHKADECPTPANFKCVNCVLNGKTVVNHASYSSLCPYNK